MSGLFFFNYQIQKGTLHNHLDVDCNRVYTLGNTLIAQNAGLDIVYRLRISNEIVRHTRMDTLIECERMIQHMMAQSTNNESDCD